MGRQTMIAFALVGVAHLALMLAVAAGLRPRTFMAEPEVTVTPVYLAKLTPPQRARPRQTGIRPPPAPRADSGSSASTIPALSGPPFGPPATDTNAAPEPRLVARALRSRVGCATPSLLTAEERLACEDRLAAGAGTAKYIPTPLPPERRAYYDAVAAAKHPLTTGAVVQTAGAPTPANPAFNRGGIQSSIIAEAGALRGVSGAAPGVGCALALGGPSGGWRRPPHALKLGPLPCYVTPPQGQFTVEANIQNPDTARKGGDK